MIGTDNHGMSAVFDKPSLRHRVAPLLQGFDGPLAFAVFLLAMAGLLPAC
jgi:rod shape determining protein RodA